MKDKATELKETREAARVTQAEVAAHLGISQSRLSLIEAGKRPITPEQFHNAILFIVEQEKARAARFAEVVG